MHTKEPLTGIAAIEKTGEGLFIAFNDGSFGLFPAKTLHALKASLRHQYESFPTESEQGNDELSNSKVESRSDYIESFTS